MRPGQVLGTVLLGRYEVQYEHLQARGFERFPVKGEDEESETAGGDDEDSQRKRLGTRENFRSS